MQTTDEYRARRRETTRRYYERHHERIKERQRKFREENRERLREEARERARVYREQNRDKVNERNRRYMRRPEVRERTRVARQVWLERNYEDQRAKERIRTREKRKDPAERLRHSQQARQRDAKLAKIPAPRRGAPWTAEELACIQREDITVVQMCYMLGRSASEVHYRRSTKGRRALEPVPPKPCFHCGEIFTPTTRANRLRFCSPSCRRRNENDRAGPQRKPISARCDQCGVEYMQRHANNTRFCSRRCAQQYHHPRVARAWYAAHRDEIRNNRRKAK